MTRFDESRVDAQKLAARRYDNLQIDLKILSDKPSKYLRRDIISMQRIVAWSYKDASVTLEEWLG